ncbi:MAG: hypothetical protein AB7G62_18455 [Magnetospirillum sp.]
MFPPQLARILFPPIGQDGQATFPTSTAIRIAELDGPQDWHACTEFATIFCSALQNYEPRCVAAIAAQYCFISASYELFERSIIFPIANSTERDAVFLLRIAELIITKATAWGSQFRNERQ